MKKWYSGLLKSIPDPKIRMRRGSDKALVNTLGTPLTELQIEIPTLLATEHLMKMPKSDLSKLKRHKFKTYKLF